MESSRSSHIPIVAAGLPYAQKFHPVRLRDWNPSIPAFDYHPVFKAHFDEFGRYLLSYLAMEVQGSRSSARQKLMRLTRGQFHELSTDVFDELIRRQSENSAPYLAVRDELHPKRNQARQKLATLPTLRFTDLTGDIYFELSRRYPEFKEGV